MLDSVDKKVLYALDTDSRQSISRLARATKLTREIVQYRMKKLEHAGIIRGYVAQINQSFFCAGAASLLCKLSRSDEARFAAIVSYVQAHPAVNWFAELCGTFDIVVTILYKNAEDLSNLVNEITQFMGDSLRGHELELHITEYKFARRGIIYEREDEAIPKQPLVSFAGIREHAMDAQDLAILAILATDCRTKTVVIAHTVKLSEDAVRLRIKRLEQQGVIYGYSAILAVQAAGFEAYYFRAHIEHLTDAIVAKLLYYVHRNPYVGYCCRITGRYNLLFSLYVQSQSHFNSLLHDIRRHFGLLLTDYEFQLLLREFKEVYMTDRFFVRAKH